MIFKKMKLTKWAHRSARIRLFRKAERIFKISIVPVTLVIAFFILHKTARHVSYEDLVEAIYAIPKKRLNIAILLVSLNYVVLTLYDTLSLRYIRHKLSYPKIAVTAFISYAFSQTVGLALLSGGAIRYRLYSSWNVSAGEIARVIAFSGIHYWMGLFLVSGIFCLILPEAFLASTGIPLAWAYAIGVLFLAPIIIYILLCIFPRTSIRIWKWEIQLPSIGLVICALVVASLDWIIAASILYNILPAAPGISFPHVVASFLASLSAGVLAHVPGALGVFEAVMLVSLGSDLPHSSILASLLLFRAVYYLLPFFVAAILLICFEIYKSSFFANAFRKAVGPVDEALSSTVPPILALNVFFAGAIIIFLGVTPISTSRDWWVEQFLPFVEFFHFMNSIIAVSLMCLAWSIWKRVDSAYSAVMLLIFVAMIFSIFKSLEFQTALYLGILAVAILRCRRYFYRQSAVTSAFSARAFLSVILVLTTSVWLGFFVYRDIEFDNSVWLSFSPAGNASRFLRASAGGFFTLLIVSFFEFVRAKPHVALLPDAPALKTIEGILYRYPLGFGNLAFLRDKYLLLGERLDGFVMYRECGRHWIALGDPIGSKETQEELIWRFRDICDQHDSLPVFYQVPAESLYQYVDIGLRYIKIGEDGLVSLENFSVEGVNRRSLRQLNRRFETEGFAFSVISPEEVANYIDTFSEISSEWISSRGITERGFSIVHFYKNFLLRCHAAVLKRDSQVVAFATLRPASDRSEISIDMLRHSGEAPRGIIEFMFMNCMLWGRENGYTQLNMGMTPLSEGESYNLSPRWSKTGTFLYPHGEHFSTFESLRMFKEKFSSSWRPRYIIFQGALSLSGALEAVIDLIKSGPSNRMIRTE